MRAVYDITITKPVEIELRDGVDPESDGALKLAEIVFADLYPELAGNQHPAAEFVEVVT